MVTRYASALDATAAYLLTPDGCWESLMRQAGTFETAEECQQAEAEAFTCWCQLFDPGARGNLSTRMGEGGAPEGGA